MDNWSVIKSKHSAEHGATDIRIICTWTVAGIKSDSSATHRLSSQQRFCDGI